MFKNFFINLVCKFLPVEKIAPKYNYQLTLVKNGVVFVDLDFDRVFTLQRKSVYNYSFIRGRQNYKLTIIQFENPIERKQ